MFRIIIYIISSRKRIGNFRDKMERSFSFSFFLFVFRISLDGNSCNNVSRKSVCYVQGKRCWCSEKLGGAEKAMETFHTGVLKFSTLCKLGAIARNSEDNEIWNYIEYSNSLWMLFELSCVNVNLFNFVHRSKTITVTIHIFLLPIFGYQFWYTSKRLMKEINIYNLLLFLIYHSYYIHRNS